MTQMEDALGFLESDAAKKKPAMKMPAMNSAVGKTVRVNVATLVNASKIRREKRAGRDVIVVPSATLPDDIVMNGSGGPILYPADEIEKSYKGLERTPAPLGHPAVNGKFVSARDPEGLTQGWIGAWNENVRRENGRVLLDKVIDVEVANQSAGGKAVLTAIEKQEPIHTSTGLLALLEPVDNADHKFVARDMMFDHDAILLNGPGAATPEQGVGMFVNSAGEEIEVINSTFAEDEIEREVTWAAESILRAVERKEQKPLLEQLKGFMLRIIQGDPTPDITEGDALTANGETMDKAQFDALSGEVGKLTEAMSRLDDKIATAVGNALKPLTDQLAAQAEADKAKAADEHAALVNQVVEAGLLDEVVAKEAAAPVLNALLANAAGPKPAMRVNGAFKPGPKQTDIAALAPKGD
ncbi:hypothetical protein [Sphingomonas paucimobilis]|uniref:hypothetical protein n=1 Tax=Sphingomonas paucimobilis TaxID=13689 RepID=UPI00243021E2|nr:hypothetical protein [Sphingomonas paucimobilis]